MKTAELAYWISAFSIAIGRLGTVLSTCLIAMFVFGSIQSGDPAPNITEWTGLAFFPIGVIAGLLAGWRWPLAGSIVSMLSLVGFYCWSYIVSGRVDLGPYFVLFTLPATFYLIGALVRPADATPMAEA